MTGTRRKFLTTAAAAGAAGLLGAAPPRETAAKAKPFSLDRVKVLDPAWRAAMELNRSYLHALDADRLLHNFRMNAGLHSIAQPLGGWETPTVELRGHFPGHYLSACAMASVALGDRKLADKASYMVAELARCQQRLQGGYLSAYPATFFDRLAKDGKVWAPWYTLHKIMAGLFDVYQLCGNKQALEVVQGMAQWAGAWSNSLSDEHNQQTMRVEHGGMLEVLYNIYGATGDEKYAAIAKRFYHRAVLDPLAARQDKLKGLHANTQIPKVIGAARGFELTGDESYRTIATYFWDQVTGHRCYCTGGTSNHEHWRTEPDVLANELSATTHECCCTYNLLKLTRQLFGWNPDPRYGDYYERALLNGIIGTMDPADGMTMYYVPLQSGYWKIFGRPMSSFWCCTGSGTENFAKLGDSIYFHDARGVWINLFTASTLDANELGLKLTQQTRFPEEPATNLTIDAAPAKPLELRVRIPAWAAGATVAINGKRAKGVARPGTYFAMDRRWKQGDRIEVKLPMTLRAHPMPDDPGVQAAMYGPLVLAGDLGSEGLTKEMHHGDPKQPVKSHFLTGEPAPAPDLISGGKPIDAVLKPTGTPLTFRTTGQTRDLTFLPLNRVVEQRYGVYWRVRA